MRIRLETGFKKMNFAQKSLVQSLILVLYKLSLDAVYLFTVTPFYDDTGMTLHFSILRYLFATLLFMILLTSIKDLFSRNSISSFVLLLINLMYFIPGCTLYSFKGYSDYYFLFFASYWIILILLNKYLVINEFRKLDITSNKLLFLTVLIIISAGLIYITGRYNHFRFHIALSDVYDLRFSQRKLNLPTIVNYFQPAAVTLLPVGLIYCLIEKKTVWAICLTLLQLLSFAFGGMKTTLFILLATFLVYIFYTGVKSQLIVYGFALLNIFALLEAIIRKFSYLTGYVLNRIFFMPNLLSYQYYDFFNRHQLLYWRESIMNRFGFPSPYPYSIPNLISRVYNKDPIGYANNGLCGDAFSNFGWFGLLIFPFLVVFFCKLADACIKKSDSRLLLVTSGVLAMGFINGSFFGLLLTNGFIFLLILIYILPIKKVPSTGDNF